MYLSNEQYEFLLKPINPARVGKDGKGFAHLEAWDVRRVLIGVFGFTGWSADTTDMQLIFEEPSESGGRHRWTVAYRACCRLTVGDCTYTEWAVGDSTNNPSRADAHDMAIKTAESQAFKRCAVNLGDAFGLSLYDGGSRQQSIKATLDRSPVTPAAQEDTNA
jgi:recombination DNA repair RAD52 pathway protein